MKKESFTITPKGIAVLAAIDAGLCPEVDGGYDTEAFEKFWQQYDLSLRKKFNYEINDINNMFKKQSFDEWIEAKGKWFPVYVSAISLIFSIIVLLIRIAQ